jgi:hypothetical protein
MLFATELAALAVATFRLGAAMDSIREASTLDKLCRSA